MSIFQKINFGATLVPRSSRGVRFRASALSAGAEAAASLPENVAVSEYLYCLPGPGGFRHRWAGSVVPPL